MSQSISLLPMLPSAFSINAQERKLLLILLKYSYFLSASFDNIAIDKVARHNFNDEITYQNAIMGLLNNGVIYAFSAIDSDATSDSTNQSMTENEQDVWYLHAEKTVQALANHAPELLIGHKILKFECDDEVFDGGFIESNKDVFIVIMNKLKTYFNGTERQDQTHYLPSFLRLYQYIGLTSAESFYEIFNTMYSESEESSTQNMKIPMIPKYSVMKKVKQQSWITDNNRICVCIT